jgi:hypothetical protein
MRVQDSAGKRYCGGETCDYKNFLLSYPSSLPVPLSNVDLSSYFIVKPGHITEKLIKRIIKSNKAWPMLGKEK